MEEKRVGPAYCGFCGSTELDTAKRSDTPQDLIRDRLWCKALISLLGEGLSTDQIEIITRRVNEMRDGKHPSLWPE